MKKACELTFLEEHKSFQNFHSSKESPNEDLLPLVIKRFVHAIMVVLIKEMDKIQKINLEVQANARCF